MSETIAQKPYTADFKAEVVKLAIKGRDKERWYPLSSLDVTVQSQLLDFGGGGGR
ncbi:MAG: hypothetical protein NTU53_19055 [Planctomycetota bacterium]|nr:hypothetical protein [Planctomycetota bacterium]